MNEKQIFMGKRTERSAFRTNAGMSDKFAITNSPQRKLTVSNPLQVRFTVNNLPQGKGGELANILARRKAVSRRKR